MSHLPKNGSQCEDGNQYQDTNDGWKAELKNQLERKLKEEDKEMKWNQVLICVSCVTF